MKCKICGENSAKIQSDLFDDRHGSEGRFSEYKCENCGFIQIDPQLPIDRISDVYQKYYPVEQINIKNKSQFEKLPNKFWAWWTGMRRDPIYLIKGKDKSILDYGSGSGKMMLKIKKMGHSVIGIDPDKKSKEIGDKLDLDIRVGFYDVLDKKDKFDYILLAQVLEHEPDPVNLIGKLSNHLKEGGSIICSFPHGNSIYRKIFGRRWIHWHVPYHLNHFTKNALQIVASNAHLKLTKFKTITPNAWTTYQMYRLFSNPKEGRADLFWGKSPNIKDAKKVSVFSRIILGFGLLNLQSPLNRILDHFELGDCCLVEFKKL